MSRSTPAGRISLVASVAFVAAMAVLWAATGATALVVYAVSFWQYLIYVLAFAYRSVRMNDFRRDAMLMRSASLGALGWVYFAEPLSAPSLVVSGVGFLLNAAAVRALGTERTYYGCELDGLPSFRVTAFPYSVMGHPMLIGNMAAYLGLLFNPDFRIKWWPLAAAHVLFNGLVILMESYGTRLPWEGPVRLTMLLGRTAVWGAVGAAVGAGASLTGGVTLAAGAVAGACMAAYAGAIFETYSTARVDGG